MTALVVDVLGIGAWAVGFEGWPRVEAALRGARPADPQSAAASSASNNIDRASRPSPALLPPAERRRAPDGVAVALEVAREAVEMARRTNAIAVSSLAAVFASAYGDLAIVDYLCAMLATDPTMLSPTRFHHSVHNAAAGYWSIAMRDHGPASAIAADVHTFAAGLLEATAQACAEDRAVLLVAFDTPSVGPLTVAAPNTALFGFAMVIAPATHNAKSTFARLALEIIPPEIFAIENLDRVSSWPLPKGKSLRALAASSPSARALVLAEAIASERDSTVVYPRGLDTTLAIGVRTARNH